MVNRPEGPTLTKSYRQRKTKEQFLDMSGKEKRGGLSVRCLWSFFLSAKDTFERLPATC